MMGISEERSWGDIIIVVEISMGKEDEGIKGKGNNVRSIL
jgi:hypothetical protein